MRQQGRLLIVDDEPDMLENVSRILGKAGYECLTAGEPRKALALMESERPDVLLNPIRLRRGLAPAAEPFGPGGLHEARIPKAPEPRIRFGR